MLWLGSDDDFNGIDAETVRDLFAANLPTKSLPTLLQIYGFLT